MLTARKVPGRKTVVSKASAFIAAPSFIPAAAIMRPEMASRVVMKLYTCGVDTVSQSRFSAASEDISIGGGIRLAAASAPSHYCSQLAATNARHHGAY